MTQKLKIIVPWLTFWLLVWSLLTFRQQPKSLVAALVLAIIGTGLIFATEMGYSSRKEGLVKWGKVTSWLKVHTIMGVTGPIVVIWHTGGHLYGFGGVLAGFTMVVLASGFFGRFLYKRVPRSIKGQTLTLAELEKEASAIDERLEELRSGSPEAAGFHDLISPGWSPAASVVASSSDGDSAGVDAITNPIVFVRSEVRWQRQIWAVRSLSAQLMQIEEGLSEKLRELELERLQVKRRIEILDTSKLLLSRWKTVHTTMTILLFTGIVVHVLSVIYYGRAVP